MACTLRYIDGPQQSGKTFLCVAAVMHAHARGLPTLWLATNRPHARVVQRLYGVPGTVWAWADRLTSQAFSVIVVDTVHPIWTPAEVEALRLRNELLSSGPTTLLVTRGS